MYGNVSGDYTPDIWLLLCHIQVVFLNLSKNEKILFMKHISYKATQWAKHDEYKNHLQRKQTSQCDCYAGGCHSLLVFNFLLLFVRWYVRKKPLYIKRKTSRYTDHQPLCSCFYSSYRWASTHLLKMVIRWIEVLAEDLRFYWLRYSAASAWKDKVNDYWSNLLDIKITGRVWVS